MKSSWAETRAQSSYHFDPQRLDSREDVLKAVGYFPPTPHWPAAIQDIITHSESATWATRGYRGQGLLIPPEDLEAEQADLERTGYDQDHVISDISWHVPEVFQQIADSFGLEDVMIRMHVQQPGQTWNLHIDKLAKWAPHSPERVRRIMVQLTDWQPGQFWELGNYHWHQWRAGDAVEFDWQNIPHCTANAGHHPRVTMQITGVEPAK